MFRKPPTDAFSLAVDGEIYTFQTPRDFEFALSGRTSLPSSKITALARLGDDELLREAEAIRRVEQRFADALSGSLEDITSVGPFLMGIDPSLISHDHSWRSIIGALNETEKPCEAYKKVALVKYMQYLTSRQEVVKNLYVNRQQGIQSRAERNNGSDAYRPPGRLRETLLLDLDAPVPCAHHEQEFHRLPKGETVEIVLEPNQIVDVMLARHPCSLVLRDRLLFVDERGNDSELRSGRYIVGRDSSSDVVISSSLRDVSRKHLVVETDGKNVVRLTDISSHGTSIPPIYLDRTII